MKQKLHHMETSFELMVYKNLCLIKQLGLWTTFVLNNPKQVLTFIYGFNSGRVIVSKTRNAEVEKGRGKIWYPMRWNAMKNVIGLQFWDFSETINTVWSLFGPVMFSADPFRPSFDMKSAKLGVIKRCWSSICRPTFNILDYDGLCNGVKVVKEWLLHIKEVFVGIWYWCLMAVLIKGCALLIIEQFV